MKSVVPWSDRFATVGFIATLIVVMSHADIFVSGAYVSFWGDCLVAGHVYNFFFISGFLIARHLDDRGWYVQELKKRVYSLIVAYFIWCVIYALLKYLSGNFDGVSINVVFGLGFGCPPYNVSLWYFKCLYGFVLVLPIVVLTTKNRFLLSLFLAIVACAWLWCHCCVPSWVEPIHFGFSLRGISCFVLGIACYRKFGADFLVVKKGSTLFAFLATIAWVGSSLVRSMWLSGFIGLCVDYVHVFVCVFSLQIVVACLNLRLPRIITSTSMFVIVTHLAVMRALGQKLPAVLNHFCCPLLSYFIFVLVVLAFCVLLALLMNQYMPKVYAVCTGGRSYSKVFGRM